MRVSNIVSLSLALVGGSVASADVYLSGVVGYGANASGSSITEPGEFDNFLGTSNLPVTINGAARGTTFQLVDGDNAFTYSGMWNGYNALSLYFGTAGDPFNRPFGSAPDLVVYGSASPLTPVAGALVQTNGVFSGTAPYGGNGSFTIGDRVITVTQFTGGSGTGAFNLNVAPIPTPAGLGVLAGMGLIATRRRR